MATKPAPADQYTGKLCITCGKPIPITPGANADLQRLRVRCEGCCRKITRAHAAAVFGRYNRATKCAEAQRRRDRQARSASSAASG